MTNADDDEKEVPIRISGDVHQGPASVIGTDNSIGKTVSTSFFVVSGGPDRWKHFRQIIALIAGLALIGTVVAITASKNEMSDALYTFLRIVLALGAAAFAVCIDGFLRVRFKTWLRATGGFAVFVIIFFFQVAAPTSSKATTAPSANTVLPSVPH